MSILGTLLTVVLALCLIDALVLVAAVAIGHRNARRARLLRTQAEQPVRGRPTLAR